MFILIKNTYVYIHIVYNIFYVLQTFDESECSFGSGYKNIFLHATPKDWDAMYFVCLRIKGITGLSIILINVKFLVYLIIYLSAYVSSAIETTYRSKILKQKIGTNTFSFTYPP